MDGRRRGRRGKIRRLIELIRRHPTAIAYDWRTRFGLPVAALFDGRMTWAEGYLLAVELLNDPASRLGAAEAGWSYPWSREAEALASLIDLTTAVNTEERRRGSLKPYPRPYRIAGGDSTTSRRPTVSQETVKATLTSLGHGIPTQ